MYGTCKKKNRKKEYYEKDFMEWITFKSIDTDAFFFFLTFYSDYFQIGCVSKSNHKAVLHEYKTHKVLSNNLIGSREKE